MALDEEREVVVGDRHPERIDDALEGEDAEAGDPGYQQEESDPRGEDERPVEEEGPGDKRGHREDQARESVDGEESADGAPEAAEPRGDGSQPFGERAQVNGPPR